MRITASLLVTAFCIATLSNNLLAADEPRSAEQGTSASEPTKSKSTLNPQMQGFWFGSTTDLPRKVLLIQDDQFIVISPLGSFKSRFAAKASAGEIRHIDIERYDGKRQLGIYKLEHARISLKLADPGEPRPTVADVTFPDGKPHWHTVFDRRPTPQGLEVLTRYFSDGAPSSEKSVASK